MPVRGRLCRFAAFGAVMALAACAPRRLELPTGDATPFPDAPKAYDAAVQDCRSARTLQVTLGLSGRAGGTGIRGNVDAGFQAPESVRLEGRAPFGRPVFILVSTGADALLYFARDDRVLRNAATAEIVEALVGLPLDGSELRALISGCGFEVGQPADGRRFAKGWVSVTAGGSTTYLQQIDGRWRVVAAAKPPLTVHYRDFTSGRAATIRLLADGATKADVTARLSDLNINIPLDAGVFEVTVPAAAEPLTLDELRRAGPLGAQ
jgi:hypothetical protein